MKKIIAKLIYAVFGKLIERRREEWRQHCEELQNELNKNNRARYGWSVDGCTHEVHYK